MNYYRLEIKNKYPTGREAPLLKLIRDNLAVSLDQVDIRSLYWLESDRPLLQEELEELSRAVFFDPVLEECLWEEERADSLATTSTFPVEISFRPGVTDNPGKMAAEALSLLKISGVHVFSGTRYLLRGQLIPQEVELIATEFLANPLIHKISYGGYHPRSVVMENDRHPGKVGTIPVTLPTVDLLQMSERQGWALNAMEMEHIKEFFARPSTAAERGGMGLPELPTDVEMEILAQTWSEHCKHKIFRAQIDYREEGAGAGTGGESLKVEGLFKTYIQGATKKVMEDQNISWAVSLFSDNAGIVRFDQNLDLCIKVETHNSPSALDPYGGALTGILGVNRDILGAGMGARPVANTDIFCLCPPDLPSPENRDLLPLGLKHPRRILEGVHKGVADGGNKSGIPTVNGSLFFDEHYAGKPLIFCGTLGVIPHKVGQGQSQDQGTDSFAKAPRPGDYVVVIGGAVGADGIHGATLSSLEMNEATVASMVQIGDPLTQKRVLDFLMEARDLGLYSCVTDNGAGGLSSSVGELSLLTNGAQIDLSLCPLKYQGLVPYEIMVSESQERMTLAVPPACHSPFLELAARFGVEAATLGIFEDTGYLKVFYQKEVVAALPLHFLHDSLPPLKLSACWRGPQEAPQGIFSRSGRSQGAAPLKIFLPDNKTHWEEALQTLLSAYNICSKESLVRQYDHEVQGATHIKPFVGPSGEGPSDAAVVWLAPHGGEEKRGVALGHGMNPKISHVDTFLMAQWAVDEAIRNVVAVGGDPGKICLVDNFCWPDPVASPKNPDGEHKLAQLVRACQGLYESVQIYGAPLVSGKDSMKNDYAGKDREGRPVKISVPPTLLITALADVPDISHTATMDFKNPGDLIYVLGAYFPGLGGSEFCSYYSDSVCPSPQVPCWDAKNNAKLYLSLHQAMIKGCFRSVHDISDGGLLVALAECMIGGRLGAQLRVEEKENLDWFWGECPGRFVVSVPAGKREAFEQHFLSHPYELLGEVALPEKGFSLDIGQKEMIRLPLSALESSWRKMW